MNYHIIVTTYQILASEFASSTSAKDEGSKARKSNSAKRNSSDSDSFIDDSDDSTAFGRSLAKKKTKSKPKAGKAALYGVNWFRIVLGWTRDTLSSQ
jgi:hypothetical protein